MSGRSKLGSECLVKSLGGCGSEDSTCSTKTQETTSEYHEKDDINGTNNVLSSSSNAGNLKYDKIAYKDGSMVISYSKWGGGRGVLAVVLFRFSHIYQGRLAGGWLHFDHLGEMVACTI